MLHNYFNTKSLPRFDNLKFNEILPEVKKFRDTNFHYSFSVFQNQLWKIIHYIVKE